MNRNFFYLLGLFFLFILSACNRDEEIPAYIRIDSTSLNTDYVTEGTKSHKITDVWVYVDDQTIGAYETPVTFPLLYKGKHTLKVRAGVKMNGQSSTRVPYPFYQFHTEEVYLHEDSIITISPQVSYFPATVFDWQEDFEGAGVSLDKSFNSDTSLIIINDSSAIFEGSKSAMAHLTAAKHKFECVSSSTFSISKGSPTYLELNYKSNNTFVVGIFAYSSASTEQIASIFINPKTAWNKIYINLTNELVQAANADSYSIFIGMVKDDGITDAKLYLDNIKLVHL